MNCYPMTVESDGAYRERRNNLVSFTANELADVEAIFAFSNAKT